MTDPVTHRGDNEEPIVYLGYIEEGDAIQHEGQFNQEESQPQAGGSRQEKTGDNTSDTPWLANKLGGLPIYPYVDEESLVQLETVLQSINCKQCKKPCVLVFQINGLIDDSKLNRVIQVFACIEPKCSKHTWNVLRCLFPDHSNKSSKPSARFLKVVESEVFGTLLIDESRHFFRPYYVSVMEEPTGRENFAANNIEALKLASKFTDLDLKPAPIEEKYKNLKNYQAPKPPAHLSDLDDYERFQLENLYGNDKTTYRFYKRLKLFQGQIVRYDWQGEPLLSSNKFKYKPTACSTCQTKRCFEFQLVPALLNYLSPTEGKTVEGFDRELIDFSTIIVSCCPKNCAQDGYYNLEDAMFVPDPDSRLYNRAKQRVSSSNANGKDDAEICKTEPNTQNSKDAASFQPAKTKNKKRNKRKQR